MRWISIGGACAAAYGVAGGGVGAGFFVFGAVNVMLYCAGSRIAEVFRKQAP